MDAMKKIDINEFKRTHKPMGRRIPDELKREAVELYETGYSVPQIIEFMSANGFQVSRATIYLWTKKDTNK